VLRHQERQRRSSRTETLPVSQRVGYTHCSCCKRCPGAGAMDGGDGVITAAAAAAIRVWREAVRATTMTTITIQPNERAVLLNQCLDELLNHPTTTVVLVASKAAAVDGDSSDNNSSSSVALSARKNGIIGSDAVPWLCLPSWRQQQEELITAQYHY